MKMLIVILTILIILTGQTSSLAGAELHDTRLLELPASQDTAVSDLTEAFQEESPSKSPSFALLRSVVLPGWGQFYTGHPYKGSVIFVAEGTLLAFAWSENRKANRNWDIYDRTGESVYFDIYQQHYNRSNDLLSWAIVTFLYNITDAYVSAHLYDFDSKVSFEEDEGRLDISMIWKFQ